jgi:hypothetical protein
MEGNPVEWIGLVKEFGVTIAVMAAMALAIRSVSVWFGAQIVIPLRDRLLVRLERFFDKTESSMDTLTDNVRSVSSHMEAQTAMLKRIEELGCGQPPQGRRPDTRIQPASGT